MVCGGGLADVKRRQCVNCVDLQYRLKREKALGYKIVYANEGVATFIIDPPDTADAE
jgi:hypothetical protein